jgi:chromatin remodeling complex protein RSC6
LPFFLLLFAFFFALFAFFEFRILYNPTLERLKKELKENSYCISIMPPKKSTKVRTKKPTKKQLEAAAAAEAVTPVVVAAPVVVVPEPEVVLATDTTTTDTTEVVEDTEVDDMFRAFASHLQLVHASIASVKTEFKVLEKRYLRELRQTRKECAKRKRKTGNRAPSGFVKPTLISNELATFLGRDSGSIMARTEVTREINAYVRKHSLQDPANGRKINPDKKLASLLRVNNGDELTYFNLQRYMSPHFAKQNQTLADIGHQTLTK